VLLALSPNMAAGEAGRRLLEEAARLDGRLLGRCLVREADVDALALLDEARDCGIDRVVVVAPCGSLEEAEAEAYEPMRAARSAAMDGRGAVLLVRELWTNLTGSLGPEDWAAALRILSPRPFLVVRIGRRGAERLGGLVKAICGEATTQY